MNRKEWKKPVLLLSAVALSMSLSGLILRDDDGNRFGQAMAQESGKGGSDKGGAESGGGHDKGGAESGGGHDKGGSAKGGGHEGGGCGGGGGCSGEEGGRQERAHGQKAQHQGHAAGAHGHFGESAHDIGADRFGGGSGLRGNGQIMEGIGRYGASYGVGPSAFSRFQFRYWGGWSLFDDGPLSPPATEPVVADASIPPGGGGGPTVNVRTTLPSAARCDDIGGEKLSPTARLSGANLNRLSAVRGIISPEKDFPTKRLPLLLLANFQEELGKRAPDLLLAGTYLGLIAESAVTTDRVKQVAHGLCVRCNDAQAAEIARVAEEQRSAVHK